MSLSMVKNEQDIIEPFIRHHARLVDCMVVVDNASVDATRRVAVACARELGNVVVIDSAVFAYVQSEQMTRLLHRSQAAFRADFVLLLDADEFVDVPDRASLLLELERISPGGVGYLPWRTFVVGREDAEPGDPPRSFRWRRTEERPLYCKAVLRLDGSDAGGLRVEQGNHDVTGADGARLEGVGLAAALLHFPVRSQDQLAAKGVVGWMANLAADPRARDGNLASQWRDAFDRVVASGGRLDLCAASMRYAQDGPGFDWSRDAVEGLAPSDYARRYSDGRFEPALSMVARSWERSLAGGGIEDGWRRVLEDRYGTGRSVQIGAGTDSGEDGDPAEPVRFVICRVEARDRWIRAVAADAVVATDEAYAGAWVRLGWEIDEIGVVGLRCVEEGGGPELVLRRSVSARSWWRTLLGRSQ